MKKISVIIPVYNVELYLEECLDSIINQTIEKNNYEIIIIDDGSTDESEKIYKRYMTSFDNIKIIKKSNEGLSMARNQGLDVAVGEYIFFCDSDDYIAKNALENLYNSAIKTKSEIIIGNSIYFNSQKKWKSNDAKYLKPEGSFNLSERISILGSMSVCGRLYLRKTIRDVRFLKKTTHEDNYFSIMAFKIANKITIIDEIVYYRRIRDDSTSIMQNLSINTFNDLLTNYTSAFNSLNKKNYQITKEVKYLILAAIRYIPRELRIRDHYKAIIKIYQFILNIKREFKITIISAISMIIFVIPYYFCALIYNLFK